MTGDIGVFVIAAVSCLIPADMARRSDAFVETRRRPPDPAPRGRPAAFAPGSPPSDCARRRVSSCSWPAAFVAVLGLTSAPAVAQLPAGLLERAEQGDAAAQADVGRRHYAGEGVPPNDAEAARWTRLAAEQGHAAAQYSLGLLYFRGRGVVGDDEAAARWYRAAAEQGHAPAQAALSALYDYGAGVEADPVLASLWIELAWRASLDGGDWRLYARQRAELASRLTPEQTAEGRRLARERTPATAR